MSSQTRIARRYAKGLFSPERGNVVDAKKQLAMLKDVVVLFDNPEAGRVLRSPVMPSDLKRELLAYALKQSGADETVSNTIYTLVDAGRVAAIPELVTELALAIDEALGIVKADVVSAVPLEAPDLQAIGENLSSLLKKKVEVRPTVDPALLGGFVVRVGNYRIDMSLKTKLDGLSNSAAQDSLR